MGMNPRASLRTLYTAAGGGEFDPQAIKNTLDCGLQKVKKESQQESHDFRVTV